MSERLQHLLSRGRMLLEQSMATEEEYEPAYEVVVFDFDQTLQHRYKPLPCVEIMRESLLAGVPVYIVTARKPNKGQEKHISEVLSWWDISLDKECIFAVGDDPKGPYVADLLGRHQAERLVFYDDKLINCDSVFDACANMVEDLQIFHLSAAVPGDIKMEITKDEEDERLEIKHSLQERKIFREWRRLSKL